MAENGYMNGFGSGEGLWAFLIFAIIFGGGNFLGGNRETCLTRSDLDTQTILNNQSALSRDIFDVNSNILNSAHGITDTVMNGTYANTNAIKDHQIATIGRIDGINYNIAQNAAATQAGFCSTIRAVEDCCCRTNLANERNTNAIIQRIDAFENAHKDEVIRELTNKDNICQTVNQILNAQGRYVMNPPCPNYNYCNPCYCQ